MSHPALITLDDGGYKSVSWKRKGMDNRRYRSIAIHCGVGHILGEVDIRILRPPKGYPPLVNGHNIWKVIEHETIHHVFADLLEEDGEYGGNFDTFDDLLEWLPNGH